MKKMIIMLVSVVILAILFLAPRSVKEKVEQSDNKIVEQKPETINIDQSKAEAKNYRESSEKYKYQIDVSYPAFDGLADKNILNIINSQIDKSVQLEVDKYIATARKNKIAPSFGYLMGKYTYSIEPGNILSVKIELEKYLSGAASPSSYTLTLDYSLEDGKQIVSVD